MSKNANILDLLREHKSLYMYDSPEGRILFSLLPMDEYNLIRKVSSEFPSLVGDLEEGIWEQCVIEQSFGADFGDINAGVITTIAQLVMRLSCPQDIMSVEADLTTERMKLEDITKQLMLKVCEAFPSYTPDTVGDLEWGELIERVAQAEKILGKEVEFSATGQQTIEGGDTAPTIVRDGVEVLDFNALNRELMES